MKKTIADSLERLRALDRGPISDLQSSEVGAKKASVLYRCTLTRRDTLNQLALDERSSVQALIHEALDDLLIKRGRDPML